MIFYFHLFFFSTAKRQILFLFYHKYEFHYFFFYKVNFFLVFVSILFCFQLSLVTNIGNFNTNPSSPVLYYVSGMSDLVFQRQLQNGHHAV